MNPDLGNLLALQDIDQKIVKVQKEIADTPSKIQAFQQELQQLNEDHARKVARDHELAKSRRALEGEVELMRSKLSRLKDQLMSVKTNKEYTAILHEIQTAENQIRSSEDEILDLMEEMELMEKEHNRAAGELKGRVSELQALIRQAEDGVPGMESEVARLLAAKAEVEKLIPGELLDRYRLIAEKRRGIALAEAADELCAMCHVRIRPQVYADLRQGGTIHSCDSCSRILFFRETA